MKILIATLHSRYIHASLALPCLASTCSDIEGVEVIVKEYTVKESIETLITSIVETNPDMIGFSCYLWNIEKTISIVCELKNIRPELFIFLGGPEVSFDAEILMNKEDSIDCIIKGEGEHTLYKLLEILSMKDFVVEKLHDLKGICFRDETLVFDNSSAAVMSDLDYIPSPFLAGLVEINKPLIYYESSRGCPFTCAFCLSSLDNGVRSFSMYRIRQDILYLINKEIKQVKFVDRTFNFNVKRANEIWTFILEKNTRSHFHFEIAADLLTDENIEVLKKVPKNCFRFEIGVQSLAEEALESVSRKSDINKLFSNVNRLLNETNVHIHLDLVAGLPGENLLGFLSSLERLFDAAPHHIQVESLKILKGTPMEAIAKEEGYRYILHPPYRIITTPWLNRESINLIDTIGRLLELIYNSGRFANTLTLLSELMSLSEFFAAFASYWEDQQISILPLEELFEVLWQFSNTMLSGGHLDQLADFLSYDRCLADYPVRKKLPTFMTLDLEDCRVSRKKVTEIRKILLVSAKTRVKVFRYRFKKNDKRGDDNLLFIYLSSPGRKQEVLVRAAEEFF